MTRGSGVGRIRSWVAVLVICAVGACSLGDRQRQADRVANAVKRTVAIGPVAGTIKASLAVPKGRFGSFGPSISGALGGFTARFVIDDHAHRAELTKTSDTKKDSFLTVLFDDNQIHAHRPDALSSEARPWYQLRLDDLGTNSGELTKEDVLSQNLTATVLSVLDPRFVLDLGAGALAGSMKDLGPDTVDGTTATHFAARFDIDTTLNDARHKAYSDRRKERQRRILHLLKIKGDVQRGDIWLTPSGLVRQLKLVVRIELDRLTRFDLDILLTPDPAAAPAIPPPPGPDSTILVANLLPIERSAASMVPLGVLPSGSASRPGGSPSPTLPAGPVPSGATGG